MICIDCGISCENIKNSIHMVTSLLISKDMFVNEINTTDYKPHAENKFSKVRD